MTFYFQLPSADPAQYVLLELLSDVLEQPFYNSLRTQQQLGYIVFSGIKVREGGVRYLTLTAQSSVASGERLTRLVEEFLQKELTALIARLDDSSLQDFKDGIIVRKLEADQRLTQRASRYWSEITSAQSRLIAGGDEAPLFRRAQVEVAELRKVSATSFKAFARDLLSPASGRRRLLVSQVSAQSPPASDAAEKETTTRDGSGFAEVVDIASFVQSQPFI